MQLECVLSNRYVMFNDAEQVTYRYIIVPNFVIRWSNIQENRAISYFGAICILYNTYSPSIVFNSIALNSIVFNPIVFKSAAILFFLVVLSRSDYIEKIEGRLFFPAIICHVTTSYQSLEMYSIY